MFVEQAIFTSARTSRGTGYHLVAASSGVSDTDARDLARHGPSHDSLWESGAEALSVNFHRLSSGAYCVSQTTPEGPEYSNRGGARIYTQSLIVQPTEFGRFANNPFAVLRTALALGVMQVHVEPPQRLEPVELFGHAAVVEEGLLTGFVSAPERNRLAALIDAIVSGAPIVLAAGGDGVRLLAAAVQALPVECRSEVTFSTGLRFSPSRSFQVCCLSANSLENRRLSRTYGLRLLEMDESLDATPLPAGWGLHVATMLGQGRLSELIQLLHSPRPGLRMALLPDLAVCLALGEDEPRWEMAVDVEGPDVLPVAVEQGCGASTLTRADSPHGSLSGSTTATANSARPGRTAEDPSEVLSRRFPAAVDHFLRLEDVIFEALAGRTDATEMLTEAWRQLTVSIDRKFVGEVRELYLRYALARWLELNVSDPRFSHARSEKAIAILETLLTGAST